MTRLIYLKDVIRDPNTVLTVGTFDGVHEGHKTLLNKLVSHAKKRIARSVLVTFDPHPRDIIQPGLAGVKLLTTLNERTEILSDLGVDYLVVIPFDRDFSLISSESFIENIIFNQIGVSEFVIGYDHHFGRNREGSIETIEQLSKKLKFKVTVIDAHEIKETTVSSTVVRRALEQKGDVDLASRFLGRPFKLNGTVVKGDGRGREIGFKTANIIPNEKRKVIPHTGVYAVDVEINQNSFRGMLNIGIRPTFSSQNDIIIEVHIFDFDEDIYGKNITVSFLARIRDEKKFDSVDSLKKQLQEDKLNCISM